jgi:L-fucose isomerase-like protein
VFQDNPGRGFQAEIFKRFYWWEDECVQRMINKFGIELVKRSFRELGARAKAIPDATADRVLAEWTINAGAITENQLRSAVKMYVALKEELATDPSIRAAGINCLNESRFSDTTPCLAWSMLYEERQLIWGCEADIMSMITKYVLHNSLRMPIMMTNLYPFLMGQAALKHERIPEFPAVAEAPEDHILAAHCGYLGVLPTSFSTEWALRKKVLAIVDDNATAIDARLPEGPMTLAKIQPTMESIMVMEGELKGYAQYPDSDCLNGGILRIADGHRLVKNVSSHHYLLMTGHQRHDIEMIGMLFGFDVEVI